MRHDDVQRLAEQGTLGGLMLRPEHLHDVRGWLRPDDFADTWHAQLYTAILERQPVGGLDPNSMAAALVERVGLTRADLPRFAALLTVTPDDPAPACYARLVAESGLRRECAGLGVLLQAAALAAANDVSATPLVATTAMVDAGLDLIGGRWAQSQGLPHDDVVVPLHLRAATRNTGLAARSGADKFLQAHPARDRVTEREHVADLVGMLVAHPDLATSVADWLPPARIEDPAWRLLYGTTVELAELDQRVDLITVAWAARAHAHHGPALPGLDELHAAIERGRSLHPPLVLRTVAADQVRQIADVGALHLRSAAANPATLVGDIVDAGHAITTTLRTVARALPGHPAQVTDRATGPAVAHGQAVGR